MKRVDKGIKRNPPACVLRLKPFPVNYTQYVLSASDPPESKPWVAKNAAKSGRFTPFSDTP
jgi:hypothetical protein